MNPFKSEPVVTVGFLMAFIYVAVAFGAPISPEQQRVMQEQLPVILPVFLAGVAWMRQSVFAPDTVQEVAQKNVDIGYIAGKENSPLPPPTIVPPPPGDELTKAA